MNKAVIGFTTFAKEKEAKQFARKIIETKLAACVQIIPKIISCYEWHGAVRQEKEALLLIKTSFEKISELKKYILEHHPYEIPEFVTVNIAEGLPAYLAWLTGDVSHSLTT